MEEMRAEAFSLLKPYCVQLTREHSRTNIAQLFSALQSINVVFLQDLQEYVIFPLRVILKHPKKCSQDLYLDLFTCMEYILGHTKVTHWDLFQDIFNTASTMLSCPTDQSKVAKLTEELKIAIIQTIRTLVKNSEHSVLQQLFAILCLPLLGHAVSLLLNIAEVERARNLRIIAMECLLDLSQADSKCSQCMKADIGSIFASFLPGISVSLCKIITGDTKQGYAVTTKAIYVWMRIVSLVMDDKLLDVYRQKQAKQDSGTKGIDPRLDGLVVARDAKWITTTGGNLAILVKQVATVRSHTNWRVRLGLVECAEHLLLHCTSSMMDCVPSFLEILVSLIGDDYSKVAVGSRHALELFGQSQASDQQRHLTAILEENLHKLTTSLPRQIQTAEEEDKLSLLNLLSGYLSLLGSKVKSMLLSLPHLKRLSLALVQILELECNDIKIVEERTSITGHGSSAISASTGHCIVRPRKYFKHFTNDKIFEKVQGICRLLGYYGDIHLLVDHFLDIFHESSMFKMQSTLVINEMVLGTTGENVCVNNTKNGRMWHNHSRDELYTVIRMLVDEYLNPTNFDLITSVTVAKERDRSLEDKLRGLTLRNALRGNDITAAKINRNIMQISLFLEGFGIFSKVIRTSFEPLLMTVLYPLLEKLGDETAYISNAAFLALTDIFQNCGYKSLDQLICNNTDYLMNAISLRLRRLEMNRKCPLVLRVMLQYSSAELLPLVDDTIKEILQSLDDNYEDESVLFMGVLNELTKAVVRWFQPCNEPSKNPGSKPGTSATSCDAKNNICSTELETKHDYVNPSEAECCYTNSDGTKSFRGNERTKAAITDKDDEVSDNVMQALSEQNYCDNKFEDVHDMDKNTNAENMMEIGDSGGNCLSVAGKENCCVEKNRKGHSHDSIEAMFKKFEKKNRKSGKSKVLDNDRIRNTPDLKTSLAGSSDVGEEIDSEGSVKDVGESEESSCRVTLDRSVEISGKLKQYMLDLLKLEKEEIGDITEEELDNFQPDVEDGDQFEDADEDDTKAPPPVHVAMVKEILLRCKHIVSSKNPRLRLMVLDTIGNACQSLQPYQEELLPLIHQFWPAFSLCFADEEKLVTIKALEVLQVISKSSGDFVKNRITKDVLPKLSIFLQNQAEISVHAGSAYQFTINYKLQLAILRNISTIAHLSCIEGCDLDLITSSCVPYLSSKQPATLQAVCMECCKEMIKIDADLMWLKLRSLYSPNSLIAPDQQFKTIPALQQPSPTNHFTSNITRLMKDTGLL